MNMNMTPKIAKNNSGQNTAPLQASNTAANGEKFHGGMASFSLNRVAEAEPKDIQSVGASNLCLLETFYVCVRNQAEESFKWAIRAAALGCLFFLFTVGYVLATGKTELTNIGLISGALVELIAGVNFYLYARTAEQLAAFHVYLDRTQRFLLANSVCEQLERSSQDTARTELVHVIATAQMHMTEEATVAPNSH